MYSDVKSSVQQQIIKLTSFMLHKYYCENDVEAVIQLMDDNIVWLGTGEDEYAVGLKTVADIFRRFTGQVPKCNISDEQYHTLQISPDTYLCSGRLWIATDASTQISLRVHQRITTIFRRSEQRFLCCHIHISNPYSEMMEGDVGFPTKMANQSYQYLQEQIEIQKKQIAAQTAALERMSYEDSLTGLYNRNKFHQVMDTLLSCSGSGIGIACFDLNGLKKANDRYGHSTGDDLIRSAAKELQQIFQDKVYRIGGDEFVVMDDTTDENTFRSAVAAVEEDMAKNQISCSVGISWRPAQSGIHIQEQLEEADALMYQHKRDHYSRKEYDRRSRSE